jgi:hypothetical protein
MPEWFWVMTGIVLTGAFFSNFYGLGDIWDNRGCWYVLMDDAELTTVLNELFKLKAYHDSDDMISNTIKIKSYIVDSNGTRQYKVKVPHYVFKQVRVKLTAEQKMRILGLTPPT